MVALLYSIISTDENTSIELTAGKYAGRLYNAVTQTEMILSFFPG
jgi:hypothetical protein